ncbi:MAG TPA: UDP-N-acetylmuramoyl-L-alanine--D-glutamate ligase [Solirubrobacteraceae bacterium]|nr:UDP-N-acetylmuramoyl-L-alanine--D-glutamate ligase [Solirubrobacteraceae bacterium]
MRFSELDGATVGVWGAGREIRSFAGQLSRRLPSARIAVVAFDAAPPTDIGETLAAPGARIVSVTGDDADSGSRARADTDVVAALRECDVVVRSPGVSIHRPELRALREAGVRVTTATSLWLAEREGRGVIGVTGTKGKSTTAALACHLARAAGRTAHLAGNIGVPALDLLDGDPSDMAVVELSSYQISDLATGPEVAVITSLFREHLDWHGSEQAYRAEKLRILGLPGVRATVVGARSEELVAAAGSGTGVTLYGTPDGWDATPSGVALRGEIVVPAAELPLPGEHNALNLCAARAALEAFGLAPPPLPRALHGFRGLPHRLETVAEREGVLWVDDSISTTPESTLAALASFPGRDVVLIGGGQDRGQDYAELGRALAERKAAVVGLPSTGPRLIAAAREAGVPPVRAIEASDMAAAVALASSLASPGAVVLLSPAAPSYDNYRDFEERGECFRALVCPGQAPQALSGA